MSPDDFDGFNLIYGDLHAAHYLSNRDLPSRMLPPGLYGLSNHLLDTPWPKVVRARDGIAGCLDTGAGGVAGMFEVLADTRPAGDDELPSTGVPLEWERRLSPIFISGRDYGTRASTVMLIGADGTARFEERNFGENGRPLESRVFQFRIA